MKVQPGFLRVIKYQLICPIDGMVNVLISKLTNDDCNLALIVTSVEAVPEQQLLLIVVITYSYQGITATINVSAHNKVSFILVQQEIRNQPYDYQH